MSTSASVQSGSNKWSKIKHKKAANDAARSATYGVLSREIISAVKNFGGPDPVLNFRLSMLLRKARELGIPKDKVEATLAKAAGKDGTELQTVTYEVLGPISNSHPPVAMMIECLTDNTRRTMASLREAFNKSGGSRLSSTAHLFDQTGYIRLEARSGATFDEIFEAAVEEGAEDVQAVEQDPEDAQTGTASDEAASTKQMFEIKCSPSEVHALAGLLSRAPHNHILHEAEQRLEPNGPVLCFEEDKEDMSLEDAANVAGWVTEAYWDRLERMRDMIESNADCQRIFSTLQGWPPR
ncbi:unnamed protein product [Tilletia controversa]|uniref:Transcriptional regulatory protein n=3 Tax=Tilletia TaxID=13289 RepID=A0A8X7MTY2_9BASI|nr:hypothetical protein CF328_g3515 [Tilletia controversa]KAE8203410.1 hypothetical protein CF335_g3032 [Tilletia laevis]KAE8261506.1 hypothetical protein A4X03_0g3197 [Tilletia caries]KAE8247681.1 hypothetical protein A4X06_0g4267 [Tilletia controversa]CAD6896329.1 unnamed protein product [Tilletia laevis]